MAPTCQLEVGRYLCRVMQVGQRSLKEFWCRISVREVLAELHDGRDQHFHALPTLWQAKVRATRSCPGWGPRHRAGAYGEGPWGACTLQLPRRSVASGGHTRLCKCDKVQHAAMLCKALDLRHCAALVQCYILHTHCTLSAVQQAGSSLLTNVAQDDLWSARVLMDDPAAVEAVHLSYYRAGSAP